MAWKRRGVRISYTPPFFNGFDSCGSTFFVLYGNLTIGGVVSRAIECYFLCCEIML